MSLDGAIGAFDGSGVIAAIIDSRAGQMSMFVDGKNVGTAPYSLQGIRRTSGPLTSGSCPSGPAANDYHGYIRHIQLYDRALSEEEISSLSKTIDDHRRKQGQSQALSLSDLYRPDRTAVRRGMVVSFAYGYRSILRPT